MATTSELLATAREKLAAVLAADPAAFVDYRIGDKSVSKSQYVNHLISTITKLSAEESTDADLAFIQFDHDISPSGKDDTQYTVL